MLLGIQCGGATTVGGADPVAAVVVAGAVRFEVVAPRLDAGLGAASHVDVPDRGGDDEAEDEAQGRREAAPLAAGALRQGHEADERLGQQRHEAEHLLEHDVLDVVL